MLIAIFALYTSAAGGITWTLTEFQPNIKNGGRANTIAVDPANNSIMFVASESGGLFKTKDGGVHWSHVASFTPYYTSAIAYVTSSIMLATAADVYTKTNSGGGIWRSTDGGSTWQHIANPPAPSGVTTRFAAGEISIAPDTGHIFVSTTYGVSKSTDKGAHWTTLSPFGTDGAVSVVAQSGNLIVAGKGSGVVRSTTDGSGWTSVSGGPRINDLHAFGRSPFAKDTLYAESGGTALYVSEDSGSTWTLIAGAPGGGGGCGGIAFVKPILSPEVVSGKHQLTLWVSNRCHLSRLNASQISGTTHFNYGGSWIDSTADHGDTRDLAFSTGSAPAPILLGTDGGLHLTSDRGSTWTFTGGGTGGYNALQITEVKGQWAGDFQFDLYFGTQDNKVLSSGDGGKTWPNSICCEGFFLEMLKHLHDASDSHVTFVACTPCSNQSTGRLFASRASWPNPASDVGNPAIVGLTLDADGELDPGKSFSNDQPVNSEHGFTKGMAETQTLGSSWSQYATFPEDRRAIPKLSERTVTSHGKKIALPVQYQAIRTGYDVADDFDVVGLLRLSKDASSTTASTYYPSMTGFGGLGINPTEFAWYEVFGVGPVDSNRLIAPDIVNQKMMQSTDGGDTWSEIPGLTSLVTASGKYLFRSGEFSFASAVAFYYYNSLTVAVGTQANGLFVSEDGGGTWKKVPNSEKATYITSVEWMNSQEAFVSTYGRGLWHLTGTGTGVTGAAKQVRPAQEFKVAQNSRSPIEGKPYLSLSSVRGSSDLVLPGEAITLHGDRFPKGTDVELLLDHRVVAKGAVDENGAITLTIEAPKEFGLHKVVIRDARSQKIIDGASFIVRHSDTGAGERR